jgi:hypothetical protein
MSQTFKKHHEDFVLLLEAGFVSIMHEDEDSTVKLFKAAQILDPHSVMPKIGLAYMHLLKLELQPAVFQIKRALEKEPENEFAKAIYAVILTFSPDMGSEGVHLLHKMHEHSKDPEIRKLTKNTEEFYEKFLKAPPSPSDVMSHKRK